jgi:hypothetical protein
LDALAILVVDPRVGELADNTNAKLNPAKICPAHDFAETYEFAQALIFVSFYLFPFGHRRWRMDRTIR